MPLPQGKTQVQIKFHTYSLPALPEGIPRPPQQKGHYQEGLAKNKEQKVGDGEEGMWKVGQEEEGKTDGRKRREREEREENRTREIKMRIRRNNTGKDHRIREKQTLI